MFIINIGEIITKYCKKNVWETANQDSSQKTVQTFFEKYRK